MRPRLPRLQRPVFLVNRRLGLVTAAPSRSRRKAVHATRGAPSPEVTGPICRVPWRGFSRPPRSARPAHLCRFAVRARTPWLEAFLGGPASIPTVRAAALPLRSPLGQRTRGFACGSSLPAWRALAPGPSPPRPPIARNGRARDGNVDPLSVACGSRPRLRPASPAADQHGCGTLGHSVRGIPTPVALLMPTFSLPAAPPLARAGASPQAGTLPYHCAKRAIRGFGRGLEPRWIVGAAARSTSELLRTLSRVAASKPTSWLSARRDRLAHLARSWGP
jgi:hypothetical protein